MVNRSLLFWVFALTVPFPPWSNWSFVYALTPCPRYEEHFSASQIWSEEKLSNVGREGKWTWRGTERHEEYPRYPWRSSPTSSSGFRAIDPPILFFWQFVILNFSLCLFLVPLILIFVLLVPAFKDVTQISDFSSRECLKWPLWNDPFSLSSSFS